MNSQYDTKKKKPKPLFGLFRTGGGNNNSSSTPTSTAGGSSFSFSSSSATQPQQPQQPNAFSFSKMLEDMEKIASQPPTQMHASLLTPALLGRQ